MPTREQFKAGSANNVGSIALTFDSNVTAGSIIIAFGNCFNASDGGLAVTDDNSNTYIETFESGYGGDSRNVAVASYVQNANSGSTTVTMTGDANSFYTLVIVEVSGVQTSTVLDQSSDNTGTSTDPDSGNVTTTEDDEYLIGGFAQDSQVTSITEDSPWVLIFEEEDQASNMPISVIEQIVSSTLTESAGWTLGDSVGWWGAILTFEGTAAGGRIMSSLVNSGGLAGKGGIAGIGGGLAG